MTKNKSVPCLLAAMLSVAGCTPKVESYCNRFGLAKSNPEYTACRAYYTRMDNWFAGDLNTCQNKASLAFPDYMYDHSRYAETEWVDRFGRIRSATTLIEPDQLRNASLDIERRKIVLPCMTQHGWASPDGWQAGRMGAPASAPDFHSAIDSTNRTIIKNP